MLADTDRDGLPDEMERKFGTDATRADSDGDTLKILEAHDPSSYRFSSYWKYETWREKRVYRYVSVLEQEAIY